MLAKLQTVLRAAQRGRYAIGAFNVSDLEHVQAVITAASKHRSPVIVNVSAKAIDYAGLEEIVAVVKTMAAKVKVPVVLNLDHGRTVELARRALAAGFSGIMFDGSKLNYARNVTLTKRVVRLGQVHGVGVEGELGQVKYPEDWRHNNKLFLTEPDQAVDFVRRTGVQALAVAIGNSHGLPQTNEKLDFERLANIRRLIKVPLVLHGASGTPAADIRRAIKLGIVKINIDTDLRLTFTAALRTSLNQDRRHFDPRVFLAVARQAMQQTVEKKIIQFGSRHRSRA